MAERRGLSELLLSAVWAIPPNPVGNTALPASKTVPTASGAAVLRTTPYHLSPQRVSISAQLHALKDFYQFSF